MKNLFLVSIVLSLVAACQSGEKISQTADDHGSSIKVVLETTFGDLVLAVNVDKAPRTSAYFLDIIDRGLYDGATFYRAASLDGDARQQLIQGGILLNALNHDGPVSAKDFDMPTMAKVETTASTGLKHEAGTVSFARDLLDTGVVIPELVIYLRTAEWADSGGRSVPDADGFPAFGKVVSGTDIVQKISEQAVAGKTNIDFLAGQILTHPIVIKRAYRLD